MLALVWIFINTLKFGVARKIVNCPPWGIRNPSPETVKLLLPLNDSIKVSVNVLRETKVKKTNLA